MVIIHKELQALTNSLKVVDIGKLTLTMYAKVLDEERYVCYARSTSATDEIKVAFTVPAEGTTPNPTSFNLDGKKFLEVASALLPFEKDISWNLDNGMFNICIEGITNISIPLEAEAVADMVFDNTNAVAIATDAKAFVSLLNKGSAAAVKNASVPMAGVVVLDFDGATKALRCASTDGTLVAVANGTIEQVQAKEKKKSTLSLPVDSYSRIAKVIGGAVKVKIMFNDTQLAVSGANNAVYTCQLSSVAYDVDSLLSKITSATATGVTADNEVLVNSINVLQTSAIGDDKAMKPYLIRSTENSLTLGVNNTSNVVNVPVTSSIGVFEPDADGGKTGINPALLMKCLKTLNKGNVTLRSSNSASAPLVISNGTLTEPDDSAIFYVMKVRCN